MGCLRYTQTFSPERMDFLKGSRIRRDMRCSNINIESFLPKVIESQNHKGWKRPLRSSSPTVNPTPPCLLNHVLKCHSYKFLNTSRDDDSTTSLASLF